MSNFAGLSVLCTDLFYVFRNLGVIILSYHAFLHAMIRSSIKIPILKDTNVGFVDSYLSNYCVGGMLVCGYRSVHSKTERLITIVFAI